MIRIWCLIALVLTINYQGCAMIPDKIIESHVHSLEQFIERFNGEELYPFVSDNDSDKVRITRFSLFDMELLSDPETRDSIVTMQIEFVNEAKSSDIHISMADTLNWIEAYCIFEINEKNIPLRIKMNMEEYDSGFWRWAISDVFDDNNVLLDTIDKPLPINPIGHEFNFMDLNHFFATYHDHLANTKSNKKNIDLLSYFLGLASSGNITFDYCYRIVFHSLQIPGWELCAEQIHRIETSNSGWLITNIKKI